MFILCSHCILKEFPMGSYNVPNQLAFIIGAWWDTFFELLWTICMLPHISFMAVPLIGAHKKSTFLFNYKSLFTLSSADSPRPMIS